MEKSKAGTIALKNAFVKKYAVGSFGIFCDRNVRGSKKKSVHAEGRAWDCKVSVINEKEKGDAVYQKLQLLHNELGIEKLIWNNRQWTPLEGECTYAGVNPHTDHIHVEQSVEKANTLTEDEISLLL
jgi:hypothetical protein